MLSSAALKRVFCLGLLASLPSTGTIPDAERELRSQIVREIEYIEKLVDRAEAEVDPDARVQFRYDLLRTDLERVRASITLSLLPLRPEPRSFPPLEGDYQR